MLSSLLICFQAGDLLLRYCECRPLVSDWTWTYGLLDDLVLVHLPEYCLDHCYFCDWPGLLVQAHQYCWNSSDFTTALDVLFRVLHDGPGNFDAADIVASEGRGQG